MLPLIVMLACGGADVPETNDPKNHAPAHGSDAAHGKGHHGPHHDHDMNAHHRFDDVERWTEVFDDPKRAEWQKPDEVVAALSLQPGMVVADIGAGTGYLNQRLAHAVGTEGKVVAVDIEPNLVAHMTERAQAEGTPQVEARLGEPGDPKLAEEEVDRILLLDVYHHIEGREAWFSALLHAVKPGGRVVIVDFKSGELPMGPPPEMKVAPDQVKSEMAAAGWTLVDSRELPYQFVHVYGAKAE